MGKTEAKHLNSKSSSKTVAVLFSSAAVVVFATAGAVIATRHSGHPKLTGAASASATSKTPHIWKNGHHRADQGLHTKVAIEVTAISPSSAESSVPWRAPIIVRYSERLARTTPLPRLSPPLRGSWDRRGRSTLVFRPRQNYLPYAKETVTVPANSRSAEGTTLGKAVSSTFTVAGASVLRLQELLAELGYLPVAFTPKGGGAMAPSTGVPTTAPDSYTKAPAPPGVSASPVVAAPGPGRIIDSEPPIAGEIALAGLAGKFSWRFSSIPATLAVQWRAGQANVITTGAVMAFEAANGLAADGVAGPLVWQELLRAAAARQITTAPYDYVYVSQATPEFVTVWRDGVNVFTTLANTGIPQSPTQVGTWPVYLRYTVTTMSGTNPNGQPYHDTGIPWVSYFNGGDALHGFLRAQYGFPQSLGCVEMPYSSAAIVYPYTPLGTLVTVE
ncbi:MAG: L,D-transpeptidase family protein [Acidimicrobiales bacterium]